MPPPKPPFVKSATETQEIRIESLGAQGDGIGYYAGQPVYLPYALPDETWRVALGNPKGDGLSAEPITCLTESPARQAPLCRHFGTCGGCAAQHMSETLYANWKHEKIVSALSRAGLVSALPNIQSARPATRRRADLGFARSKGQTLLGFFRKAGHSLVDIQECPVLHPTLSGLLLPLRQLLAALLPGGTEGEARMTAGANGVDLTILTRVSLDLKRREALASFAQSQNLARLSWGASLGKAEPVIECVRPCVRFANIPVDLPPGAFLQATQDGEDALRDVVLRACAGLRPVADLYCGLGSFTLPLAAEGGRVHAVEGDVSALESLRKAAARAGLHHLTSERRDLARNPLLAEELDSFRAVVFDPPRVGALEQAQQLAQSRKLETVVAISCNPTTFARDAALLVKGGWQLKSLLPVDQFLWSPHVELAAVFRR